MMFKTSILLALPLLLTGGCQNAGGSGSQRLDDSLKQTVVAVVVPNKNTVFCLSSHKDKALAKAAEVNHGQTAVVALETDDPSALFDAVQLDSAPVEDMLILNRGKTCGGVRHGSDTGCLGHETQGTRRIRYRHNYCITGQPDDECWSYRGVVERYLTYPSKAVCENNGAATTVTDTRGNRCDQ